MGTGKRATSHDSDRGKFDLEFGGHACLCDTGPARVPAGSDGGVTQRVNGAAGLGERDSSGQVRAQEPGICRFIGESSDRCQPDFIVPAAK